MTAERVVAFRPSGRGRQSGAFQELLDLRDELGVLHEEALALVATARPHVDALRRAAIELGPVALGHANALAYLLARHERQHEPDGDPAGEKAA